MHIGGKAIHEKHAHTLRSLKVALRKLREKNVKKDLKNKTASFIAKIAKKENASQWIPRHSSEEEWYKITGCS